MPPRPMSPLKIALAGLVAVALALIVLNFARDKPTAKAPRAGSGSAAPAPTAAGLSSGSAAAQLIGRTVPSLPPTLPPAIAAGSASASAAIGPPKPSELLVPPAPTGPYVSPVARFAGETRDDAWAAGAETQLRARLADSATAISCRATTCQLQLAPLPRADLPSLIARLESQAGLVGLAQEIVLGAVQSLDDERATMTVHARLR